MLTYWKTILEPDNQQNNSDSQQNRLSNKKLIISKSNESTNSTSPTIHWKKFLPSLELLHNDQLIIHHRHELIRPIFLILEKSFNQTTEFEQKTYIHQLCTTALLNLYTQLKPGFIEQDFFSFNLFVLFTLDECNPDIFNSEIIMECMKRTNDLHTTQQCLMLLSKGAQLFPVSKIGCSLVEMGKVVPLGPRHKTFSRRDRDRDQNFFLAGTGTGTNFFSHRDRDQK